MDLPTTIKLAPIELGPFNSDFFLNVFPIQRLVRNERLAMGSGNGLQNTRPLFLTVS